MSEREGVPVEGLDPLRDEPQYFPHEVDVEWEVIERGEYGMENPPKDFVVFAMPDTLPEARSAYCNDPVFKEAVDAFAEDNDITPEAALRENTRMRLSIEKRMLDAGHFDENVGVVTEGVQQREHVARSVNPPDEDEVVEQSPSKAQRETVDDVKQAYVEGELTELELEQELESVMSE